jgi:hypothetical protein
MINFPKVLVAAPTASAKKYCFEEWLDNVMDFTYPNFKVVLFDNTDDNGEFTNYMSSTAKNRYGFQDKFGCLPSSIDHSKTTDLIEKMCISHNDCRHFALLTNCDYLLHLESDVFPEKDVIEQLMFHQKKVVGGIYYRDEGMFRKPMLQMSIEPIEKHIKTLNFEPIEDLCFIDGNLKKVAHVGLGCVLIKKSVLNKIRFRFEKGIEMHPDSYFAEDCFRNNIPIYADTSVICRHENKAWGIYGIDYK